MRGSLSTEISPKAWIGCYGYHTEDELVSAWYEATDAADSQEEGGVFDADTFEAGYITEVPRGSH